MKEANEVPLRPGTHPKYKIPGGEQQGVIHMVELLP